MARHTALHRPVVFANHKGDAVQHMRFWLNWEEHAPFLLRLCLGWVGGNEAEARELLSSAMLKAWEGAQKASDDIGNYRAWLARVVRNHCIDQQRRQNRDPQVKTDPELLAPIAEGARVTHQASPEATLLGEESYARLLARMDHLPLRLREVMMLRAYQNMSYKEIGQRLQISTENARKRVQMARTLLREVADPESEPRQSERPSLEIAPQAERAATEAILNLDRLPQSAGPKFASPVAIERLGMVLELPVLLDHRPMRLVQKAETLRKYLDRHPSGWKKELELARLLWTMGEAEQAIIRLASAFERQPKEPEIALAYLRVLQALGEQELQLEVAQLAREHATAPALDALYLGYEAQAQGDMAEAARAWQASHHVGGRMQRIRLWLVHGQQEAAVAELQAHLRQHPMDREAFWYMALAATKPAALLPANALHWAGLARRRFPFDPYASACHLVAQWQDPHHDGAVMQQAVADALRLAPDSYLMMALKAAWAQFQGQSDKAMAIAEAFLAAHPQHWQAHHFAHKLATMQGDRDAASRYQASLNTLAFGKALPPIALDLPLGFLNHLS